MYQNQKNVKEFQIKAGQNIHNTPTEPSDEEKVLRIKLLLEGGIKLLLEEVFETAEAAGVEIRMSEPIAEGYRVSDEDFSVELGPDAAFNMVEYFDGLVDIDYIPLGRANSAGLDIKAGHEEVHRSNMSKFIDGYRRDDGKWIKGKSYTPANMQSVINNLSFAHPEFFSEDKRCVTCVTEKKSQREEKLIKRVVEVLRPLEVEVDVHCSFCPCDHSIEVAEKEIDIILGVVYDEDEERTPVKETLIYWYFNSPDKKLVFNGETISIDTIQKLAKLYVI